MRKIAIAGLLAVLAAGCGKPGGEPAASSQSGSGGSSSAGTIATIQQKLAADKGLAGSDIKAVDQGGSILLEGTVANQAQKDAAEKIVLDTQKELHQTPGVLNNLMLKENGAEDSGKSGG